MAKQGFIVEAEGPSGLFGVFEDNGETGYLYLYDQRNQNAPRILAHAHMYNRRSQPDIKEGHVKLDWTEDFQACRVFIGGQIRGSIEAGKILAASSAS